MLAGISALSRAVGCNTMKTQTSITQIILRLLLVTATLMLVPHSARAGDGIPFKGEVNGTTVGVAPDPGGVILTLQASGHATHLGWCFREEVLLFNPLRSEEHTSELQSQ